MKNFFKKIEKSILLFLGAIFFCISWPFLLIFGWIKSIFSNKISDSDKVSITKEIILIFAIVVVTGLIYYLSGFL